MNNEIGTINRNAVKEIKSIYLRIQNDIKNRLDSFEQLWASGSELDIYSELAFCLLTPQSKAKSCWPAVENLVENNLLFEGSKSQLSEELNCVRFKNTKAGNLINIRKLFLNNGELSIKTKLEQFEDPYQTREWLVENIKGMGYKEASHFLRNIGFGEKLAILDRHILKNLKGYGVISEIPDSISRKKYLEMEKKMTEFSDKIRIPLAHLDLLLWYKETGEIFK